MNRSRSAFALGVVATLLAASGCSADDPQPKVAPSEPASASTSPSPTGPVEPTMPAAAKKHTAAGAEAFVRFYWEMVNYAQETGDVSSLRHLGTDGCQACRGGIAGLQEIFAQGGRIRGGISSIGDPSTQAVHAGAHRAFAVTANITNSRQVIDYPGKKHDVVHSGATVPVRFIVDLTADGLAMAYWDRA